MEAWELSCLPATPAFLRLFLAPAAIAFVPTNWERGKANGIAPYNSCNKRKSIGLLYENHDCYSPLWHMKGSFFEQTALLRISFVLSNTLHRDACPLTPVRQLWFLWAPSIGSSQKLEFLMLISASFDRKVKSSALWGSASCAFDALQYIWASDHDLFVVRSECI